jgi:hypothetical protein
MGLEGKTANKGEWAEIYVFLKLLGEGRLYAADRHLEKKSTSYVDVLKIIREETAKEISEYVRSDEGTTIEILVKGETVAKVPASDFLDNAKMFFGHLSEMRGASNLASEELVDFSRRIHINKVKAPSLRTLGDYGGKTDIVIMTRDGRSALVSTMGFSIKSQFASPPTLYNAGASTQFEFEIAGMDDAGMREFNDLDKTVKSKVWTAASALYRDSGWEARYIGTANSVTKENFFLIRDSMPELMAWMYKRALLESYPLATPFTVLAQMAATENPLGYPSGSMYEKVIKDFLFASFSGMTGAVPWDGMEQVNGGYIVVLPDGEVLCYHANDREAFRHYLFTQTHIEYVSRRKFKWGKIRKEPDGRFVLPLNGAARFYSRYREADEHVDCVAMDISA